MTTRRWKRALYSLVISGWLFQAPTPVRGDLLSDVQQAIAECNRPQILLYLQQVNDPFLYQLLIYGHLACLDAAVRSACEDIPPLDALLAVEQEVLTSAYITEPARAALLALIANCILTYLEGADGDTPQELMDLYLLALKYAGAGHSLTQSRLDQLIEAILEEVEDAGDDCDLSRLLEMLYLVFGAPIPDEHRRQIDELILSYLKDCLLGKGGGLDSLEEAEWLGLILLLMEHIDGKTHRKLEDLLCKQIRAWFDEAARDCDFDRLGSILALSLSETMPNCPYSLLNELEDVYRRCTEKLLQELRKDFDREDWEALLDQFVDLNFSELGPHDFKLYERAIDAYVLYFMHQMRKADCEEDRLEELETKFESLSDTFSEKQMEMLRRVLKGIRIKCAKK